MSLIDATLVLLLAARIHNSDDGIRNAARNVVKRLPRSKRDTIYSIINHPKPLQFVNYIAQNLDE